MMRAETRMNGKERRKFPITLESWGWSQQGDTREENQDSFLNWADHLLWAVADGVGGGSHGGAASRFIIRGLMQVEAPRSLDEHISTVASQLAMANDLFHHQRLASGDMSASTVVTLLIHDGMAACLWAGDSRCYLFRNGILYQCTRDHTLRQEKIDKGELTRNEAFRMIKGNIITNAVGANHSLRLDEERFPIRAGDRFLLCTDGLTNLLSPEALTTYLGRPSAREAVAGITEALEDMHQPDNITFVTVFLSHLE